MTTAQLTLAVALSAIFFSFRSPEPPVCCSAWPWLRSAWLPLPGWLCS
ncbi:hypothetical protein [Streptomyces sp. NPDC001843]